MIYVYALLKGDSNIRDFYLAPLLFTVVIQLHFNKNQQVKTVLMA